MKTSLTTVAMPTWASLRPSCVALRLLILHEGCMPVGEHRHGFLDDGRMGAREELDPRRLPITLQPSEDPPCRVLQFLRPFRFRLAALRQAIEDELKALV